MKDKIDLNSNAVILRKEYKEDSFSPIDVFSFINNIDDITLVYYPISKRISGMCIKINKADKLIAINSTTSYGRQRFTVAHELYHLFFQEKFVNTICPSKIEGVKDIEERNANQFASFFLAPHEALQSYISTISDDGEKPLREYEIIQIEQHFGMSRQATLFRLVSEKYITLQFANTLKTNVIQSARKFGFDDSLYIMQPPEKQYRTTGKYIELVELLNQRGIISHGKYEEYLLEAFRTDIVYNLETEWDEVYD
ncbi:MAG TPA: ImmA/IrrE family metallo-endopeptidase [Anaerolineaceae bacterium]|nr:ImmA/IrrE family metallo-endopeptidase [Anaerolineaceae bacterium]